MELAVLISFSVLFRMLPRARLIVRKVVFLPVCASIVFLRAEHVIARLLTTVYAMTCSMARIVPRGSPPVQLMYNALSRALPLSSFLLLSPHHGRAALTRSFEAAANVRLRVSDALRAMFDSTVANRKREDCFPPRCRGVWEQHALMYMLLAAGLTGRSHDDPKASPLFVATVVAVVYN